MAIENVVIAYQADISDIERNVRAISSINKQLATQISGDFTKGFSVINSQLKNVQFDKQFRVQTDKGSFDTVRGTVSTFEKTVRSADGQTFKFTETIGKSGKTVEVLSSSLKQVTGETNKLSGKASQLTTNFKSLTSVNASFNKQLSGFGQASRLVGTSLNQISNDGSKVSKIFETTDGRFVKLTETTKRLPNGLQNVSRSVQELSKAQAQSATTIENTNKRTESFTESLVRLGKRALLTIPVWFALRNSIFGVFRAIRDGLKSLSDFDRALQKLRRNLSATSDDLEGDFNGVQSTITEFSLATGKSVEEITNAIQKFATVGFDLETSLTGGLQATKLAITLFGDVEGTAQAFARSLRVLTEDMDTTEERQTAIAEALALTDQLWQTNAFEINEFSNNLEKFAGTANVANLSIEDTLTLLATLSTGGLSNRAGRLLRTTLLRSLQDIEKVTKALELDFDPNKQPTIEFILALVGRLKELRTVGNIPVELAEILGDLFSVRSTEVVASLVSLEKTLKENIALIPDVEKFEDTFEEQLATLNRLVERHQNLNKEMKKAFVTGLLGAGNYQKALQLIVSTQEKLIDDTQRLGAVIRNSLLIIGTASVVAFRKQLLKLLPIITSLPVAIATALATSLSAVEIFQQLSREAEKQEAEFVKLGANFGRDIIKGLEGNLSTKELDNLIGQLEVFSGFSFDEFQLPDFSIEIKRLREIRTEQEKITKEQEKQNREAEKENTLNLKRKEIAEQVLESELEKLKAQGASQAQLLQFEQTARKTAGIEKETNDQLTDQLAKQRAINAEKELGNTLSSRTQKLFEIAQKEGTETARRISEVLRGQRDFNTFIRQGGKDAEVFKKEFEDIFKTQQQIQFFRGDRVTGIPGLRGGSTISVALEDEALINGIDNLANRINSEISRSEAFVKALQPSLNKTSDATDKNTRTLEDNTRAMNQLISIFQAGGTVTGSQVASINAERNAILRDQNIRAVQARVAPQTIQAPTQVPFSEQKFTIAVQLDGSELQLSGTPEQIQNVANQVSEQAGRRFQQAIQVLINNIANNPQSPEAQAVDQRINEF